MQPTIFRFGSFSFRLTIFGSPFLAMTMNTINTTSTPRFTPAFRAAAALLLCIALCAAIPTMTFAQNNAGNWQQFGYGNPVQFGRINPQQKTFNWQFLQARNFDVYFYQDGEYTAQYAAALLEESLQELQRTLNYVISDRIPVMVYTSYGDYSQSNTQSILMPRGLGETADLPKNRINIAFEGNWAEFRRNLRHKLVHAFITEMYFGGLVQSTVSSGFRIELPQWLLEGLAEYFATGGYDTQLDAYVRDLVLSGQFSSPATLSGVKQYRLGQAFFAYVVGKYGQGKLPEFIARLRAVGSLETTFRGAFGMGTEAFWRVWQQEIASAYKADAGKYEAVESFARPVAGASDAVAAQHQQQPMMLSPAVSPLGDKIAFVTSADEGLAVFVSNITNAFSSSSPAAPSTAPNGKTAQGRQSQTAQELASTSSNGLNSMPTKIMSLGRVFEPEDIHEYGNLVSWKQDGKQLAVAVTRNGKASLCLVNLQSGEQTLAETGEGINAVNEVAWSPDGKFIAFVGVEKSSPNLYLYDIATRKVRKLTDDVFSESSPVWAWDGRTLFFLSDRGKFGVGAGVMKSAFTQKNYGIWDAEITQSDIYSLNLATLAVERVTSDGEAMGIARKGSFAVAPDNQSLLITNDKNGISNVYQLNLQTGTVTPKTNSANGIIRLSLSKNGAVMGFVVRSGGGERLAMMPAPLTRKPAKTPEFTSFKKELAERDELAGRAAELLEQRDAIAAKTGVARDTVRGYGVFDVDFTRQKMIYPEAEVVSTGQATTPASTAPMAERDTASVGNLRPQPYKFTLTNDFISINPSWDTFSLLRFSLQTMFTDILANHRLMIASNLIWDFRDIDLLVSYAYLPEVIDYEVNAFYTSRAWALYDPSTRSLLPSRVSVWGLGGRGILPLSSTSRIEGQFRWINTSRDVADDGRIPTESRMMFIPEVRYVFDTSEPGVFAPETGTRGYAAIDASPGLGIGVSSLTYARIVGDVRKYIPVADWFTIALRASGGASVGGNAPLFYTGNMDNIILGRALTDNVLPFRSANDLALMMPTIPLRGVDIGLAQGTNYTLVNAEVRVPILRNAASGILGNLFQRLQANVFVDAGTVWSGSLRARLPEVIIDAQGNPTSPLGGDLYVSMGVGLRTFLLGIPIKFDLAWLNLQNGISTARWTLGLGGDF
jgi:Tol biopolymer transport system component